jgi:hypothetical protein
VLAGGLLLAGLTSPLAAGPAGAAACGPVPAGAPCTVTGTFGLVSGPLSLAFPDALDWHFRVSFLGQDVVDLTPAHRSFVVENATGDPVGWHVTVAATQFRSGRATLPDVGTFFLTGSVTSPTATTAPTAACIGGSTCTLPTDTTTYPVAITTAASSPTPVTIYDAGAGTGLGATGIGGTGHPVGWWLGVPAFTQPAGYAAIVTVELLSAP